VKKKTIIIGAGHAGGMTAIFLSKKKYKGQIILIGQENHYPYQRPPLSKDFLTTTLESKHLYLKSENFYKRNSIRILKGQEVKKIDRQEKHLKLENGNQLDFENLVLATGSLLTKINTGCNGSNINYLRSIEDAIKLKNNLLNKKSVTIIGAGYIGLEVASSAIKHKLKTTIIEMEDSVMKRSVSNDVSNFFEYQHSKHGVKFLFNRSVNSIKNFKGRKEIVCNDGTVIHSDFVVVGVGVKPNMELAEEIGLECNNGIIVDENGVTNDPNIYAVGDCTNQFNKLYKKRLHFESVQNCIDQSNTVASSITGNHKPFVAVPWFWSDQYDLKLQIVGIREQYDEKIIRGNIKERKFSVLYLRNRKLISIECINQPKDFIASKKLIQQKKALKQSYLANPEALLNENL
jgi:3-phenylpropionate/trans-cinnamate dioxygenase ferredoxin reductase subunit